MKKLGFKVLCMVLVMALLSPNVFAATPPPENSLDDVVIDLKQKEIDSLFTELNELAMEKTLLETAKNNELSIASSQTVTRMNEIRDREAELNAELERLGVNEIDPNNANDMKQLEEVMLPSLLAYCERSGDPPPSLSEYAQVYTIHQTTSTTTVNGKTYNYSYITVTDNKGYPNSPLTVKSGNLVMLRRGSFTLADALDKTFEFGKDELVGQLPWYFRWGLTSVFPILSGYPGSATVISLDNKDIYLLSIDSKTQMGYCYVDMPNAGWTLCGVKAPNIKFTRNDILNATINGEDILENNSSVENVSTGVSPTAYVGSYVLGGSMAVHDYGYYTVEGELGIIKTIIPGFAIYPIHLMH